MTDHRSLAQQAYEAYAEAMGWTDPAGVPLVAWDWLPERAKDGWHAVTAKITELVT